MTGSGPVQGPGVPVDDIEDTLTFAERSEVDFVLALRRRWAGQLYRGLRAQHDSALRNRAQLQEASRTVVDRGSADSDRALRGLPLYPWFSALERIEQKMLWRAVGDIVLDRRAAPAVRTDEAASGVVSPDGRAAGGTLDLDPDLALPDYYTGHDIHLQPNGVWGGDPAADVYRLGARIVMLRDNDDLRFHRLFVGTALPPRRFRRIVDLGCGFGKSTRPLADAFGAAEVVGIDLSAPVLRLAHAEATRAGLPIHFRQRDCRATGLPDGSADLVTGTMLLHEMPADAIAQTLRETARLLAPGGVARFLEFAPTGDAFFDATVRDHARRNNEPFLPDLLDLVGPTLEEAAADAGLVNPRWLPFDELRHGLVDTREPGRTGREWHFPWAVLAADKPEATDG